MKLSRDTGILASLGGIALLLIGAGIVLGGSPWEARAIRRDQQLTQQLTVVQERIIAAHRTTNALPDQIPSAQDVPATITYTKNTPTSYTLCTTFERATMSNPFSSGVKTFPTTNDRTLPEIGVPYINFYGHPAGQACWKVANLRSDTYGTLIFDVVPPASR
jgi:hypothetical protein